MPIARNWPELHLCGPFCREVSPFADFPDTLTDAIGGYAGYLSGEVESRYQIIAILNQSVYIYLRIGLSPLDGRPMGKISIEEVVSHTKKVPETGLRTVVAANIQSV